MTNKVENGDDFRREEHDENDEDDAVDPRVKVNARKGHIGYAFVITEISLSV